jgi:hypothetical protein
VKKVLLLLSVTAVMVLLFAPVALADHHTAMSTATSSATSSATPTASASATATATATASATATATVLPKSGGSPLVLPITLAASLALVASGLGALALLRRSVS